MKILWRGSNYLFGSLHKYLRRYHSVNKFIDLYDKIYKKNYLSKKDGSLSSISTPGLMGCWAAWSKLSKAKTDSGTRKSSTRKSSKNWWATETDSSSEKISISESGLRGSGQTSKIPRSALGSIAAEDPWATSCYRLPVAEQWEIPGKNLCSKKLIKYIF